MWYPITSYPVYLVEIKFMQDLSTMDVETIGLHHIYLFMSQEIPYVPRGPGYVLLAPEAQFLSV